MSKARHILIVEDEPSLAALLEDALGDAGFEVSWLQQGLGVADWVRRYSPSLVLLDLGLPDLDGVAVCQAVRSFSTVPLIMITARSDEADRLSGLEIGADDYICKPFNPREVIARANALLRRSFQWTGGDRSEPGLGLDEAAFEGYWQGQPLGLTAVEFRLLRALSRPPGRVLNRAQLLDAIYEDHRIVNDRTIDSHVKNLRRKLTGAGGGDCIESVYGVGYKFSVVD
ncbi:MAG: response regulator [Xanthomonadales bacterium]|nr:response regulator [Xanthomonadales bacterium]